MKNCTEVYKPDGNSGGWVNDDYTHTQSFILVDEVGTKYKICSHCGGKLYPKDL